MKEEHWLAPWHFLILVLNRGRGGGGTLYSIPMMCTVPLADEPDSLKVYGPKEVYLGDKVKLSCVSGPSIPGGIRKLKKENIIHFKPCSRRDKLVYRWGKGHCGWISGENPPKFSSRLTTSKPF